MLLISMETILLVPTELVPSDNDGYGSGDGSGYGYSSGDGFGDGSGDGYG